MGVNAAGLKPKLTTFKKVMNNLKPSIFFIEESKFKEEGKIKLENFLIFELIRESKDGGGGLAIGCTKELKPVLARKGDDEIEALTVDILVQKMRIKCVIGYGPQENSKTEKKNNFWKYIEEEVIAASDNDCGFILHFDGNLWAGSEIIPGDPREQNKNGKLFQDFLSRNPNLIVVNALPICEGLITRSRIKGKKEERSILDFFIVCTRVLPFITKMVIDEKKEYILTNYKPAKTGEKAKDSDHFTQYLDIDLKICPSKPVRKEFFNFNNKESQKTFKTITSNSNDFSKCFETQKPLLEQIDEWRMVLKSKCQDAFKKVRIRNKKPVQKISSKLSKLIDIRNKMVNNSEELDKSQNIIGYCSVCGQQFSTKFALKNHQSKHRNKFSYKCNESDNNCTGRQSLNLHEEEHRDGMEFTCKYCRQSYDQKTNLTKHVRKHTVEKPRINKNQSTSNSIINKCRHCGKMFGQKKHLNVHGKRHTDGYAKIPDLEKEIADIEAEENRQRIIESFKTLSENPENVNIKEVWTILKKICPKYKVPLPIAKRNFKGKIITDLTEIKKLLKKEYTQRLRKRPFRPDLGALEIRKNEIFNLQLKQVEESITKPWKMKDLDRALADLKNKKSRDHAGYINEIFKEGVIGTDLKKSLLTMFNKMKVQNIIPEFMKITNLTTVPKKGSLTELENERGIFRVDIIRSILMKIIYNEIYSEVDENMSDSQMGGRKGKSCRFNLFIINGIIHDVLRNKNNKPVIFQIFDYAQMFDSMNLELAISDIYGAGLRNSNLRLLYEANKKIHMAVNTPEGPTDRKTIENSVLQGDVFGSLMASVQVDSIGKECAAAGYGYKYKNILPVGMLGLVDDTICVSEAGFKAQMLNAFFNIKTAEKALQFGAKKCKTMLVGRNVENIHRSRFFVDQWSVQHIQENNSEETCLKETYIGKVEMGQCDAQKYLGFIISNSDNNMANIKSVRNKSFGTIRTIFTKLKALNLRKYYFECGIFFG